LKLKKTFLFNLAIAVFICSTIIFFYEKESLERFRAGNLDLLFQLRGSRPSNPNIVVIEIADEDIAAIGRWPWPREWYAAMTKALESFGAKTIYFDILFSETASPKDDYLFAQAMKEAGNVYLPFVLSRGSYDLANALLPIDQLASVMRGTGAINIYPDIDGTLRRIPLYFVHDRKTYPSIALRLAMDYDNLSLDHVDRDHLILSKETERITIPLIENNKLLINWTDRWGRSFTHYSFIDVLAAYQSVRNGESPPIDVEPIKGSICLVALTSVGLYDIKPSPLEPEYPSVGAIANTVSNILDRQFLTSHGFLVQWFLIFVFGLIPSLLASGEKPLREILLIASCACVFFLVSFLLFMKNIWVDFSLPLLALFASYLGVGSYNLIRISVEKQRFLKLAVTDELTTLYNIRYFKMILGAECTMAGADSAKTFCLVMIDIDHFKHFNDTYGHQAGDTVLREVALRLKNCVRTSDVVARYGGEEMIILLRGAFLENGLAVGEKLRRSVGQDPIIDGDNTYTVTISVGVAAFRADDTDEKIIKRADNGLYSAKHLGRNRVETSPT